MGKFLLLLLAVAVVIYVVTRLIQTRGHPFRRTASGPAGPPRPRGPLGPDDDPDFLRDLNRRRRQNKKDDRPDV